MMGFNVIQPYYIFSIYVSILVLSSQHVCVLHCELSVLFYDVSISMAVSVQPAGLFECSTLIL